MTRLILALVLALACAAALTACRTDSPPSHGAPAAPVPTPAWETR